MMTVLSLIVFAATLATSLAVLFYTLVPAIPRIVALLSGGEDIAAVPSLVLRDRRVQSRVRSMPQPAMHRAAA